MSILMTFTGLGGERYRTLHRGHFKSMEKSNFFLDFLNIREILFQYKLFIPYLLALNQYSIYI